MSKFRLWTAGAAAIFVALVSTGCVDQRKEVALYRKQLDALAGVKSVDLPQMWDPLTLQQALRLTEQTNESLGLSGEQYLQALIARDRQVENFLPTLSLGPSLSESQRVRGQGGSSSHRFSLPLTLNENVFDGFQNVNGVSQANLTVEQQRQLLLDAQQTVMLDTVQTYYAVLQAERSVVVDENSLAEQQERVRQSDAQFRLGSGTPLAIAQSQAQASSTRVQLISDRNSVITSRAMLSTLVGQTIGARPLIDGFESPDDIGQPLDGWLAEAQQNRQDLRAAELAVQAARYQVSIAMGEYLPSVDFSLSDLLYADPNPGQGRLGAGLSANIPLFTAGKVRGDVRDAFSGLRSALLAESQTKKKVEQDIRVGYADLENARDQISELRIELKASRDALVLAQRQFTVGLATNLDLLTAQSQLLSTQLQLAKEEYQEKIEYMNLLRVTGRLNLVAAAPTTQPVLHPDEQIEVTVPEVTRSTTTQPNP